MAQSCAPAADISPKTLESSEFLPSIFDETETFGPDVAEAIAQRVNDAVNSKKPLETKLKELQDKNKLPRNCNLLCVPKVNLELSGMTNHAPPSLKFLAGKKYRKICSSLPNP